MHIPHLLRIDFSEELILESIGNNDFTDFPDVDNGACHVTVQVLSCNIPDCVNRGRSSKH